MLDFLNGVNRDYVMGICCTNIVFLCFVHATYQQEKENGETRKLR